MADPKPVPMKVTIDEATSEGHYVNFANISTTRPSSSSTSDAWSPAGPTPRS